MYTLLVELFLFLILVTIQVNGYPLDETGSDLLLSKNGDQNYLDMAKRASSLSMNADIQALAKMLNAQQRRRRVDKFANIRQRLIELGKRANYPVNDRVDQVDRVDKDFRYRFGIPTNLNVYPSYDVIDNDKSNNGKTKRDRIMYGPLHVFSSMLSSNNPSAESTRNRQLAEEIGR